MQASVKLLESAGATVVACIDVIEIESLHGTDRVTAPCYTGKSCNTHRSLPFAPLLLNDMQ